jgi:hypothetical protein
MHGSEADVPGDPQVAESSRTGGRTEAGEGDKHSTTGTTSNDAFVGRVSGEDADRQQNSEILDTDPLRRENPENPEERGADITTWHERIDPVARDGPTGPGD